MGLVDIDVQIDKFICVSEAMIEETGIFLCHIGQAFNCNLYNLRGLPKNNYKVPNHQNLEYGEENNAE